MIGIEGRSGRHRIRVLRRALPADKEGGLAEVRVSASDVPGRLAREQPQAAGSGMNRLGRLGLVKAVGAGLRRLPRRGHGPDAKEPAVRRGNSKSPREHPAAGAPQAAQSSADAPSCRKMTLGGLARAHLRRVAGRKSPAHAPGSRSPRRGPGAAWRGMALQSAVPSTQFGPGAGDEGPRIRGDWSVISRFDTIFLLRASRTSRVRRIRGQ